MPPIIHTPRSPPPIFFGVPNGADIWPTQEFQLQLDQLPTQARAGHIPPGLAQHSLISIGIFCGAGYTAKFTSHTVHVKKGGNILLRRRRDPPGLWHLLLANSYADANKNAPECHTAYHTTTKAEHMQYLHSAAFSLVPATYIKAIRNGFSPPGPVLRPSP